MRKIEALILTVMVAILAATVPCCVSFGQTEPNQKFGGIPPDLLATPQDDLKDDLAETKSCLERDGLSWNESLDVEQFDLNRTRRGWFVQGLGRCLAGNANSPIFLYIRDGDSWRQTATAEVLHAVLQLRPSDRSHNSKALAQPVSVKMTQERTLLQADLVIRTVLGRGAPLTAQSYGTE